MQKREEELTKTATVKRRGKYVQVYKWAVDYSRKRSKERKGQ